MNTIKHLVSLMLKEQNPAFFESHKKRGLLLLIYAFMSLIIFLAARELIYRICVTLLIFPPDQLIFTTLLVILGAIWTLLFVAGFAKKIYFSSDNDLFSTLPATSFQVYLSKFLTIFLQELINAVIFMLPILAAFVLLSNLSLAYLLLLPIIVILLTLFSLVVASMLTAIFVQVIAFLKGKTVLSIVVLVLTSSLLIYLYLMILGGLGKFMLSEQTSITLNNIKRNLQSLSDKTYFFHIFSNILYKNAANSLLIVLYCLVFGAVGTAMNIAGYKIFKKLISIDKNKKIANKVGNSNTFFAIMAKDFKLLLRSPSYIFQFFLYPLVMPIFVLSFNRILLTIDLSFIGKNLVVGANILLITTLALLSTTYCATAISREGANFYLLKTVPVSFKLQALSKLLINFVFVSVFLVVSSVMLAMLNFVSTTHSIMILLTTLLLLAGQCCLSFEFDLVAPVLDWYDFSEISDVNGATAKSIGAGLVIGSAVGIFSVLFIVYMSPFVMWVIISLFSALFCAWRIYVLKNKLNYFFKQIEI